MRCRGLVVDRKGCEGVGGLSTLEQRLVVPFHLYMMGGNARTYLPTVRDAVVGASVTVTADNVRDLLRASWRPMVMGAWFALALPTGSVRDEVVAAMDRAQGSLTAVPLAAVSTRLAGPDAIGAMETYLAWAGDPLRRDGSYGVVCAAIAHLGETPPEAPTAQDVEIFGSLLEIASGLRSSFEAAR